ncbi:DUF7677 family protein [Amycolatopsis albispora]|uniref:DUF7677 domain-containing protein n=1 Tax=Amycolatopsis albispora TaxID=1804986 RepID=A0A344L0E5_9PSEU|nr:hypothetical protein [Amycolatopsis albispora]AXB41519.1 hypothetical protein A4R43_02440 [Amycolatopsis albispora]
MTSKLSHGTSGALRTFAFWVANGTVGHPLLDDIDYWDALRESPSYLEMTFAIFANVLEIDDDGEPVNAKHAERRAAAYIYQYMTGHLPEGEPPFQAWETALY